jgi:hypothetical protein
MVKQSRQRSKRHTERRILVDSYATALAARLATLAARGESTIGRVPSAARADARRRDAGDVGLSSRSANAADAPAPPEPFGRPGIAGNICVARRQRWPRIASSSRLDLVRNTRARDLLYFHHGLLVRGSSRRITTMMAGREARSANIRVINRRMSLLDCCLVCFTEKEKAP